MPTYDYDCPKCGVIEIFHGIKEAAKKVCPECGSKGLTRLISGGGGIVFKGRQANQYKDVKAAKFWRDKNGVRHPVTSSDGRSSSPTVSRQTRSNEQVEAYKKWDREQERKKFAKRVQRGQ